MNVLENYSLNKLNSFKVGASAKQFISLKTEEEVIEFSKIFDHRTTRLQILGGGTNTLFVHDFDGLVVHMQLKGIQIFGLDKTNVVIRAAAGENWDDLVVYSIEKATLNVFCLSKFEKKKLSLISGLLGSGKLILHPWHSWWSRSPKYWRLWCGAERCLVQGQLGWLILFHGRFCN